MQIPLSSSRLPLPGVTSSTRRGTIPHHWEAWAFRAALAIAVAFALARHDGAAALHGSICLVLAFLPLAVGALSRQRVARVLDDVFTFGVVFLGFSDALGLYASVTHWGKVVHGTEGLCVAVLAAFLLQSYVQRKGLDFPLHLTALTSMFVGITFGAFWEIMEFLLDWVLSSDMQKSNTDTMTDMLWNDLAAIVGTVVVFRVYSHLTPQRERDEMGDLADWLLPPIGGLLDRHGHLIAALVVLAIAAYVALLWYAGRPVPGIPTA